MPDPTVLTNCPSCHAGTTANSRFCAACGQPLAAGGTHGDLERQVNRAPLPEAAPVGQPNVGLTRKNRYLSPMTTVAVLGAVGVLIVGAFLALDHFNIALPMLGDKAALAANGQTVQPSQSVAQPAKPTGVATASPHQVDEPKVVTEAAFSLKTYQESLIARENLRRAHPDAYQSDGHMTKAALEAALLDINPDMKRLSQAETEVIKLRGNAMMAGVDPATGEAYPAAKAEQLQRELREGFDTLMGKGTPGPPKMSAVVAETKRLEEKEREFIQRATVVPTPSVTGPPGVVAAQPNESGGDHPVNQPSPSDVRIIGVYHGGGHWPDGPVTLDIRPKNGPRVAVVTTDRVVDVDVLKTGTVIEAIIYPCSVTLRDGNRDAKYEWCLRRLGGELAQTQARRTAFEKTHPRRFVAGIIKDSVGMGDGSIAFLICNANIDPPPRMRDLELARWATNGQCLLVAHPLREVEVQEGTVTGPTPDGRYYGHAWFVKDLPDGMVVRGQPASVPLYETNPPDPKSLAKGENPPS